MAKEEIITIELVQFESTISAILDSCNYFAKKMQK
jgi:hypothetical protein